jgi:hypothetical protein
MTWFARFVGYARLAGFAGFCALLALVGIAPMQAHKPITSKYSYNADVWPIFRNRCGACHAPGGVAPMSLLDYKDALPWAESIREELIDEKMPPWYVDPSGARVKGTQAISPKEIDTIVTWATGGTPEGSGPAPSPSSARATEWPNGAPDLVLTMDDEHTVPAEQQEDTYETALKTTFASPRWVTLADLQPGAPDLVRDATIAVENGPLLAAWMPGERPVPAPNAAAFALPPHATIVLRVHYKKPWQDERKPRSDRSRIGLYFSHEPAPGRVETLMIGAASTLPTPTRIVALRPLLDQPYADVDVHAVLPSGGEVSLLRLHRPRPEWNRRYWLESAIDLPAGTRVEIRTAGAPIDPDDPPAAQTGVLQLAVEYVAR